MIRSINIDSFKKFEKVNVAFPNFTVLMGENGSGKTSLLQAVTLALRVLSTTDLLKWDATKKKIKPRPKGVPYTQLPGLYVEDPKDVFYGKRTRGGGAGGANPIRLDLTDKNGNVYRLQITNLFGAFNVKLTSTAADFKGQPILIDHPPLFISGFVGIEASEERFFPLAIQDRLSRGRASEVLRNLLLELSQVDAARFARLKDKLRANFDFELGRVSFIEEKDINVHANYRENLGKRQLDLDLSTAGSGFLQVLQILTPIYRYADRSKVVLLDEPDAHLHPNLQRVVARVLQETADEEGLQLIISTHSTAIIREVEPESVIPVSNRKTKLKPLASSDELESEILARLDNFTTGKASIAGKIVFVEDEDRSIIAKVDSLSGIGLLDGTASTPVLSAQGKDDKIPFRIKKSLENITGESIDVFFIRDGDGLTAEWRKKLESLATSSNVNLRLLERHEIESYLIVPELFERVLLAEGAQVGPGEIEPMLVDVLTEVIATSKHGFERTLRDTLNKTGRLLKETYNFSDAEGDAIKIREQYESLTDFEDLVRVAPAKESLKEFGKRVKARYGIQIGVGKLLKYLTSDDISPELKNHLQAIKDA